MKLKFAVLFLAITVLYNHAAGQDITVCEANLKTLEEQVRGTSYADAYVTLAGLRKTCPTYSEKIYKLGETVLNYNIEAARTADERQVMLDDLAALYRQYDKSFPKNTNAGAIKLAMLQDRYQLISKDDLYKKLDTAFKSNRGLFTDYNALEAYFLLYLKQYQAGDKGISQEQFIEQYGAVSGQAIAVKNNLTAQKEALLLKQQDIALTEEEKFQLASLDPEIKGFEAVLDNITILAVKHFTCDKLELYYEKNYEANKANAAWLEGLIDIMLKNKCHSSAVLHKSAVALHELKPTAQSAYYLGSIAQRKNHKPEAITYFKKSAELNKNSEKKAETYYTIASLLRGKDKREAKEFALKAAQENPKSGRAYLFLAELYTAPSKDCKFSAFETKALYWLAIETIKKAEAAEPRYKSTVAKLTEMYSKKLPTKDEVKAAGLKRGKNITFGCWINESITIPNL